MKLKSIAITICYLSLLINSQGIYATSHMESEPNKSAIHQMAQIMLNLNHYPDASGKASLKGIIENSSISNHIRTLANAMLNINHYAAEADKAKLQAIISDDSASDEVRKLAGIIKNIAHMPSATDKESLHKILE